jgi:hypothetical protein
MKFEITNFDDASSENDEFSGATPEEPSDGHSEEGDDTSTAQFSEVEHEISDDDSSSDDDEFSVDDEDSSDEWT